MPAKTRTTRKKPRKKKVEKPAGKPASDRAPERARKRATTKTPPNAAQPPSSLLDDQISVALAILKSLGTKKTRDEMGPRYGVAAPPGAAPLRAFGVSMANMKLLAKELKKTGRGGDDGSAGGVGDAKHNHDLAAALWDTGWYEARMVASMVDEPTLVTAVQMDRWCRDFDNWGICDTVCFKLFDQVAPELAFRKVEQWSRGVGGAGSARGVMGGHDEFVTRAAFALLACVALHNELAEDKQFQKCLPLIERAATDERNFVKKGVSWALRSVGRRSPALYAAAVTLARRLADSPEAKAAASWVGKDVLKDLTRLR